MTHRLPHTPLLAGLVLLILAFAPTASADFTIGSQGSGAGQYENPLGVAVDSSNGRVYLADANNSRIDVFESSGEFLFAFGWGVRDGTTNALQTCGPAATPPSIACFKGIAGAGAGQLLRPEQIAVDSTSHVVYLSETENHRVQKFDAGGNFEWTAGGDVDQVSKADLCTVAANCGAGVETSPEAAQEGSFFETAGKGLPLAIGPGGTLYVADSRKLGSAESEGFNTRIQRYEADGTYLGPQMLLPPSSPDKVGRVQSLALDSAGAIYVATDRVEFGPGVRKYNPDGSAAASWAQGGRIAGNNITALGIDPADNLFFVDGPGSEGLRAYDPAGTQTKLFFSPLLGSSFVEGLAFHHDAGGDLFATNSQNLIRIAQPPPGPLLVPGTTEASPVGSVKATLRVAFNAENKASTARFQYVDKESFESEGGFASPNTQETPPSAPTPADFENHTAESTNVCVVPTEASCLKPETTYYFRAIASNVDGEVIGDKAEFTTLPPILLGDIWSTEVGTDSARLHAEANPLGVKASGYFQYIEEGADYQANGFQNAEVSPTFDLGAGEEMTTRSTQLLGLRAATAYHYRVVAENPYFPPRISSEQTLTTFAPPGKAQTGCPNQVFRTGAGAALPDCRAYEMVSPLDKNNGDIVSLLNSLAYPTFLDQSSRNGQAFTYSSYRAFADPEAAPYTNQYLATRHELGHPEEGWRSKSLAPKGRGAEFLEAPFKAFSPDLSHAWLSWRSKAGEVPPDPCAPSGFLNLYRRENTSDGFNALSCSPIEHVADPLHYQPEVQGFSADGSISVFRADEALTPDASPATTVVGAPRPIYQLYLSTGSGQLRLLSVLPGGKAADLDSSAGTVGDTNANTYWNINRFGSLLGAVSEDGRRVFWSQATAGVAGPLYLRINADQDQSTFDKDGKCKQPTRACTIAVSEPLTPEPARFQMGDPQGTRALFTIVGNGPLKDNLYRFDSEAGPPASELIAEGVMGSILGASEDLSRVYFASTKASAQAQSEGAEVGEPNVYLAEEGATRFIATLSSGGEETSDVNNPFGTPIATAPIKRTARVSPDGGALVFMSNSGELAERVAGYDNTDAASGQPDAEVYHYDAEADDGAGKLRCVSCSPTGARPTGRELEEGSNNTIGIWGAATIPRYQSQLFQPRYLSDGGDHVFFNSFEALVLGDTNGKQDVYQWEAPGAGDCTSDSSSYLASSEGCLALISSGQSPADSELLDASPSGTDVFFTTVEGLVPQDYGLIDVYDARVEGGFPPPPGLPAACEGEACQGAARAPEHPTPASAAFEGEGNVKATPTAPRCRKGKVRRRGRCVKAHKRAQRKNSRGATNDRRSQR